MSDVLKREELYELVWSESLIKIAKQFGWSLGKLETVCREMEIPRPPQGFHSKLAAGRDVERTPLPPLSVAGKVEVDVQAQSYTQPLGTRRPIKVSTTWAVSQLPLKVGSEFHERAVALVTRLLGLLERQGHTIKLSEKEKAQVLVDKETLSFQLCEEGPRPNSKSTENILVLLFDFSWRYHLYLRVKFRTRWQDNQYEKLEGQLEALIRAIGEVGRELKAQREVREAQEFLEKDAQGRFRGRQDFLKKLEAQAICHQRAQTIRAYLTSVEASVKTGRLKEDEHLAGWLKASRKLANDLDPLTGKWSEEPPQFTNLGQTRYWSWNDKDPSPVPWWPVLPQ